MSDVLFVSGDFSGIQDYVLSVSAAGGGQARRLRARSFYVQAAGEVAAWKVLGAFNCDWDCVLVNGGGQFLLRLPASTDADTKLRELAEELSRALYTETQGELGLTLACGRSLEEALRHKEREKRRLWRAVVASADGWRTDVMSLEEIAPPWKICRRRMATHQDVDGEPVCARCEGDTRIGRELPRVKTVGLGGPPSDYPVLGTPVHLHRDGNVLPGESLVPRSLGRHVPVDESGSPVTFEQIADKARGDNLLAILKADVDSMGIKLGQIARQDPSLQKLRDLSTELDNFFAVRVQQELDRPAEDRADWRLIYTIYSGGDDLLLVGPWNVVLDFAGWVRRAFAEGPGTKYGLTLSAGLALTPYRLPVRHAVERAGDLLKQAKADPKNRCAALGSVWDWSRHDGILGEAKAIVRWVESGVCGRAMIHRLLVLAESKDPKKAALWAYEVGRNFPRRDALSAEALELRQWGEQVLAGFHDRADVGLSEVSVALRYALIATRSSKEDLRSWT
jgi:CRISPR-associated protein Csm1